MEAEYRTRLGNRRAPHAHAKFNLNLLKRAGVCVGSQSGGGVGFPPSIRHRKQFPFKKQTVKRESVASVLLTAGHDQTIFQPAPAKRASRAGNTRRLAVFVRFTINPAAPSTSPKRLTGVGWGAALVLTVFCHST